MSETDHDPAALASQTGKMTDEELLDSWQTASEQETEHLSPFLRAVVDEMGRRGIPFAD